MAAGNEAWRSDRIERKTIRSLHFVTLPAAIHGTGAKKRCRNHIEGVPAPKSCSVMRSFR